MSAAHSDATRRIAEVNDMITRQELLRTEAVAEGFPVERIDNLTEILRSCVCVIEASLRISEEQAVTILPPSMAA